jgi:hypothetical protein
LIPGQSPKRSGPSRTSQPGGRVWPRSRSSRDLRRDRMWRRLRVRPKSCASGLSLIRSEERVSRAVPLPPVGGGPRRSATGRPARARHSALARPAVSRGHLPRQGRIETCHRGTLPKQAGSGDLPRGGAFAEAKPRQLWFQRRASRRSARLKARTRRGQAAVPIAAGAWEARRATGYVDATV